jgi:hypothetical protein
MNIFIKYLYWQLILTPKKILTITKNYLAFGIEFFSIKETMRSLFSPWRRYTWGYDRGFDIGKYLEVFLSNIMTRTIGFVMRLFLIVFFITYEVFVLVIGIIATLIFTVYPAIAVYGIIYSFNYL